MKKITVAAAALAFTTAYAGTITASTSKTKKAEPSAQVVEAKLTPDEAQAQIAYLDGLASKLKTCNEAQISAVTVWAGEFSARLMKARADAYPHDLTEVQKVQIEKQMLDELKSSPTYQKCQKDAMAELNATSATFLRKFPAGQQRDKATEALAYWMNAINSIGTDNFQGEQTKFSTSANVLKLNMSI